MGNREVAINRASKEDFLIESLKLLVDGLGQTFGSRCEVVLHDLRNLDRSIVKIANGHITGRSAGGPITDFGLRMLKSGSKEDLLINYPSVGKDGRKLKSSTFLFRKEKGKPIAALCINFDVTDILSFNAAVQEIFEISEVAVQKGTIESFEDNMRSTLNGAADKAIRKAGKAFPHMKPEDRKDIVQRLDSQGFFLIKGSVRLLAEKLNVSKFAIYNYLEKVRAKKAGGPYSRDE